MFDEIRRTLQEHTHTNKNNQHQQRQVTAYINKQRAQLHINKKKIKSEKEEE